MKPVIFYVLGSILVPALLPVFLTLFLSVAVKAAGICLLLVLSMRMVVYRARRDTVMLAAGALLGVTFVFVDGLHASRVLKFLFRWPSLHGALEKALDRADKGFPLSMNGVIVDLGPPRRVAFVVSGIMENWCGIVYDPTGLVLRVNQYGIRDLHTAKAGSEDEKAIGLFGGDLFSSEHLLLDWYWCWFT